MDISKLSDAELLQLAQQYKDNPGPVTPSNFVMQGAQGMTVDNMVRQAVRGVPVVGSFMDEVSAVGDAATQPVLGRGSSAEDFSGRYKENVARERAIDSAFEKAYPKSTFALQLGGGVATGGAIARGVPAVGNAVFGNLGTTLPQRMIAGGAAGTVLGAAHGSGEGTDPESRLAAANYGAMVGGPMGVVTAPIAAGIRSGVNAVRNWNSTRSAAADIGAPYGSVSRVARNVEHDQLTPAIAQQRAAELGPEGMVLDMGRQLRGRAEAVATMPGTGQNMVLNATEQRVKTANDRIGRELDGAMGRSPDMVELGNRIDAHYRSLLKPLYDNVMSAHPKVWDANLQDLTRRPSIQRAIDDAVHLARESGDDITSPFIRTGDGKLILDTNATPNLRFWDYVKKSLDSRINAYARNPDMDSAGKSSMGALLETKRALLSHLDELTGGGYRQAREAAADKFAIKEGLETGLNLFQNKMLPEQFAEELRGMGRVERLAIAAGARRALERMREVSPSNVSEGARAVYRELLQGGPNGDTAQKLRMLLGDQATDGLIGSAQRETGFQSVYDQVANNSRTATRQASQADMQSGQMPEMSLTGIVNRLPVMPVEKAGQGILDRGNQRTREGIADILTRQGADRDTVIDRLIDLNAERTARAGGAPQLDNSLAAALQASAASQGRLLRVRPMTLALVAPAAAASRTG
jgi:hypothetical protein